MIREDLDPARKAWLETIPIGQKRIEAEQGDFLRAEDSEESRIDFHALRHTTATWFIQLGADIKTVQTIMRHSDIKLTLDRYGHLFPGAEADAVTRMRKAFNQPMLLRKTGTDPEGGVQHLVQQSGVDSMRQGAKGRHKDESAPDHSVYEKTPRSQGKHGVSKGFDIMRAEGLEPSTQGLKVLCSTD